MKNRETNVRPKVITKIVMTPKLQQALRLLQIPTLELQSVVKQELLINPLLEEDDDEYRKVDEKEDIDIDEQLPEDIRKELDIDWEDYFRDGYDLEYQTTPPREQWSYEHNLVNLPSFRDGLLHQLRLHPLDEYKRAIGEFIINNLDDDGYCHCSLEEIANCLEVPVYHVEEVLNIIHTFEPYGVGARNLQECLLIQLCALDLENSLTTKIVRDHFSDLCARRFSTIAKALGVSVRKVRRAVDFIASLAPKPGFTYSPQIKPGFKYSMDNLNIIPDLIVERVGDQYVVSLNDKEVPKLRINPVYRRLLTSSKGSSSKIRAYIIDKLSSAKWLIKTIEQRRKTMLKVMNYIVETQREFFEKGVNYLKPLTLQKVAQALDIHESTVSRVTSDKYVQTPCGVFGLKFFFSSSLETTEGKELSVTYVRTKIAELIHNENPRNPLNDQQIAKILRREGINLARRTVAKYREQLNVLPARLRKR